MESPVSSPMAIVSASVVATATPSGSPAVLRPAAFVEIDLTPQTSGRRLALGPT
jgi:hypothetical protein